MCWLHGASPGPINNRTNCKYSSARGQKVKKSVSKEEQFKFTSLWRILNVCKVSRAGVNSETESCRVFSIAGGICTNHICVTQQDSLLGRNWTYILDILCHKDREDRQKNKATRNWTQKKVSCVCFWATFFYFCFLPNFPVDRKRENEVGNSPPVDATCNDDLLQNFPGFVIAFWV